MLVSCSSRQTRSQGLDSLYTYMYIHIYIYMVQPARPPPPRADPTLPHSLPLWCGRVGVLRPHSPSVVWSGGVVIRRSPPVVWSWCLVIHHSPLVVLL